MRAAEQRVDRYLPPSLVAPFWHAKWDQPWAALLEALHLPRWLFPQMAGTPSEWANNPIVNDYVARWTGHGPPPYRAWLVPAVAWGVFLFALYGALLCLISDKVPHLG